MRTVGIVAEYNPFHNGHKYHINKAKTELKADFVLIVMSGNFVQRGEPAIIDKWKRCEMCLKGGADLVVELPVFYAVSSAEYFADAAISIMDKSNVTDYVSFGAEADRMADFLNTAHLLAKEPDEYKEKLKSALSLGNSFPKARAIALRELGHSNFETPNNILVIEYLKALKRINSKIEAHICLRQSAEHNSAVLGKDFSSATAIRKAILRGNTEDIRGSVPKESYEILSSAADIFPNDFNLYTDMLKYRLACSKPDDLKQILDISEGIEHRIISAMSEDTVSDIISKIKTKRYTFTKIQRILLHILLGIKTEDMLLFKKQGGPQYIRVLGFRQSAEPLLKKLTEKSSLPVIINTKKHMQDLEATAKKMLEKELEATDIYFIKQGLPHMMQKDIELKQPVIKLKI